MRVIVFFDLPTITAKDRRNYRWFRKNLINEGFIMMQESVYSKLALNSSAVGYIERYVDQHKPPSGLVQMMTVTEKQFARMKWIVGEEGGVYVQTMERTLVL